ncbi:MAG TPA: hypothetical protein VNL14_02010 [Candidatus Acidoferrales bacterium]|nr:hypothetical protein [Candidatus Acidoferrales bacterium]
MINFGSAMTPVAYLLIAVAGGILAAVLAIALLVFIVSFVGWLVTLIPFGKPARDAAEVRTTAPARAAAGTASELKPQHT